MMRATRWMPCRPGTPLSVELKTAAGRLLRVVHADRATVTDRYQHLEPELEPDHEAGLPNAFWAPPPRPQDVDLAVVTQRTGSPEELAAEILEAKARLQERSAVFFSDAPADPEPDEAPGFYERVPLPPGRSPFDPVSTNETLVASSQFDGQTLQPPELESPQLELEPRETPRLETSPAMDRREPEPIPTREAVVLPASAHAEQSEASRSAPARVRIRIGPGASSATDGNRHA